MDFLSYKTLEKRGDNVICIQEPCDYIVLNSISSLGKCMERLACYSAIHCYLDNDQPGTMAPIQSWSVIKTRQSTNP